MGAPKHGYNALIYVSGVEIYQGNAWSLDISTDAVETPVFGATWKDRVVGMHDWSGSVKAWDYTDSKTLLNAAAATVPVAIKIYPDRSSTANYYSGDAIFSLSGAGGTDAAISGDVSFVGDGTLTITGWTA